MSERGAAKFDSYVKSYLDSKYTRCAICNCILIPSNCTREHVIPVAVYKWGVINTPELDNPYYIKRTLGSSRNGVRTCMRCNDNKSVKIIPPSKIRDEVPYCDDEWYVDYKDLYESLNPLIESYKSLIKEVAERDGYKCSNCDCELSIDEMVPRRIYNQMVRAKSNCRLLCERCNEHDRNNQYQDKRKYFLL